MTKRIQKEKTAPQEEVVVEEVEPKVPENAEVLKSELDELLDEIDSVLEVNASDFVRQFVQKGENNETFTVLVTSSLCYN